MMCYVARRQEMPTSPRVERTSFASAGFTSTPQGKNPATSTRGRTFGLSAARRCFFPSNYASAAVSFSRTLLSREESRGVQIQYVVKQEDTVRWVNLGAGRKSAEFAHPALVRRVEYQQGIIGSDLSIFEKRPKCRRIGANREIVVRLLCIRQKVNAIAYFSPHGRAR